MLKKKLKQMWKNNICLENFEKKEKKKWKQESFEKKNIWKKKFEKKY